jgi:hypothetical protein
MPFRYEVRELEVSYVPDTTEQVIEKSDRIAEFKRAEDADEFIRDSDDRVAHDKDVQSVWC